MSCNNCSSIKNNCNKNCSKILMFFSKCFPCLKEPIINNKKMKMTKMMMKLNYLIKISIIKEHHH